MCRRVTFTCKRSRRRPGSELNLAEFEDIPIPLNSKLDKEKSIIISKNRGWLGRLNTSQKTNNGF